MAALRTGYQNFPPWYVAVHAINNDQTNLFIGYNKNILNNIGVKDIIYIIKSKNHLFF